MLRITEPSTPTGTFVDGQRLEKGGKAELIPGKSTVTIGRCPVQYVLHLDSSGLEHNGHTENAIGVFLRWVFVWKTAACKGMHACMHDTTLWLVLEHGVALNRQRGSRRTSPPGGSYQ